MRIVDVCAFYTPHGGGVKTYVEHKLRAARAAGHEMIVLAPGAADTRADAGGGLAFIKGPKLPVDRRYRYFADEAALHRALWELAPDIVEASSPWGSASMVARWPGPARRALIMHCDPMSAYAYRWLGPMMTREHIDRRLAWYWRRLERLDRSFDLVVSPGRELGKRLRAGGLRRVETIPLGVEPGIFSPARRDERLRATLLEACALPPDATLMLGVGRMGAEKRWPMVIEAVTAAGYGARLGLALAGDGRDRARVAAAAANNPHIRILSPVRDRPALAAIMASADALVHACEGETYCMVAAEARASGLPLVLPDRGGAADHHRPGCGLTYEAASGRALRAALQAFMRDAPGFGARARDAARSARTMDLHFDELFSRYDGLTAQVATCA